MLLGYQQLIPVHGCVVVHCTDFPSFVLSTPLLMDPWVIPVSRNEEYSGLSPVPCGLGRCSLPGLPAPAVFPPHIATGIPLKQKSCLCSTLSQAE